MQFFMRLGVVLAGVTFGARLVSLAHAAEPASELRGGVVDKATGATLGARVYIQAEDGRWYFPKSADEKGSAVEFKREYVESHSVEMHTTLSPHPFVVSLPPGGYTLTVERGKEYLPLIKKITLGQQPVELKLELERFIDMPARGWYSGDTHIHHPLRDVPNLILAEDIHIAFPLSHWVTSADQDPISGNRIQAADISAQVIQASPQHLIYPLNTEYEIFTVGGKNHTLGAFVAIGHKRPLNQKAPPVAAIAEQIHREGGLIDLEKHSWPWSVAIVPVMKVDLFELANNHCWRTNFRFSQWTINAAGEYMQLERDGKGLTEWGWIDFGFQTYYALLNCGFKLQPTAGTGAGVHPAPLGFGRVYVHQPDGFDSEKWLRGLREGRSFVTTGPLLEVKLGGEIPGHVFANLKPGDEKQLSGLVESIQEIERIELVKNGQVSKIMPAKTTKTSRGTWRTEFAAAIRVDAATWVAVRCLEKHPEKRIRFAHTAPWHCEVPGTALAPTKDEKAYLVGRCREEIERNRPVLAAEAMAEFEQALQFYERLPVRVP